MLGAEKVLIQKSGYYARAAASNEADLALIKECCDVAVESALAGIGGVVGQDEDKNDELRACEFPRIAGGKPFDIDDAVGQVTRACRRTREDRPEDEPALEHRNLARAMDGLRLEEIERELATAFDRWAELEARAAAPKANGPA